MSQFPNGIEVNFIRLLFTDQGEEDVAYRWAARLAVLIGGEVLKLRPETTLEEMMKWAMAAKVDSMDFVVIFEPELGMEFAGFLDEYEDTTFRAMVQYCAKGFHERLWGHNGSGLNDPSIGG